MQKGIGKVDVVEDTLALIECNVQAVEKILGVGVRELGRVVERRAVGIGVGVILYSFDDVTETISSECLLSHEHVDIREWLSKGRE